MAWTLQTAPPAAVEAGGGTNTITINFTSSTQGTTLIACLGVISGVTPNTPSGWILAASGTGQGGTWIYIYPNNPGGLTSVTFTESGNVLQCLAMGEFSPSGAGVFANVNAHHNGTSAASLIVTTASNPNPGDLGIACFMFGISTAATVAWTTPASWSVLGTTTASAVAHIGAYYFIGVPSNTSLSVTGSVATVQATLQGAVSTFSLVTAATGTAGLTLTATSAGHAGPAPRGGVGAVPVLVAAGIID
jgi:hypothetical protein